MIDCITLMKQQVLDMAIRGQLVGQQLIEDTKDSLIEIKKEKKISIISEEEIPFDLPINWKWVRLGDIFDIGSSKRITKNDWRSTGVPFYRARELVLLNKNGEVNNDLFVDESLFNEIKKKYGTPHQNDIMMTGVGTIGIPYIVKPNDRFYFKDASILWFKNIYNLDPMYFKYAMESNFFHDRVIEGSSGTTVATYTISRAKRDIIPFPPQSEQRRIVKKIQEIFTIIEQISERKEDILETIQRIRETTIHEAIRGNLVQQNENDEPASEIIQQIGEEKERLIKEKIIKKSKLLPQIPQDSEPFEIPENWEWTRLGQISNYGSHQSVKSSEINLESWLLDLEDIESKTNKIIQHKFMQDKMSKSNKYVVKKGDVLYGKLRPYLNKVAIAEEEGVCSTEILPLRFYGNIQSKYMVYVLSSNFFVKYAISNSQGTKMPRLGSTAGKNALIPLPPIMEQKKIVEKIDSIMKICDEIERRII